MKKYLIGSLLSFFIAFVAAAGDKPLQLAVNGQSEYKIIISAHATASEQYAAGLLQSWIKKISGAEVPVLNDSVRKSSKEILIGFSNRTSDERFNEMKNRLAPDGFQILTTSRQLYILGGSDQGVIYGVVDLLEKSLGCRKYAPGIDEYPNMPTIHLKAVNYTDQPASSFRVVNGQFCKDKDYKCWHRLDVVDDAFGKGYYVHTFHKLVPPEEYYELHPEYFAFMNGKRVTDQLCPSHPEVLKITIEKLRSEMALQPEKKIWSVSQNDNYSYCQCPDCRKAIEEEGVPSGPIIRFVNKVAEEFPDKIISTLAYQYSRQAPKAVKPLDNVQIMLCTIELNRAQGIESDPSSRLFLRDMDDWTRLSNRIYLWDYTVNFSNYLSPFPNLHTLQPNISYFIQKGAKDLFQQSNTATGHEFSELKSYLISKLLWNPDINPDSVIDQFLAGYYKDAAPYIREYIDLLKDEYLRSGQTLDIYGSPVWNANTSLSPENMAVYNYLFDKAEKVVARQLDILKRVKVARLPIQFATIEIAKNDLFGPRGWYTDINGKYILRPKMKSLLENFNSVCKSANVEALSEAGPSPEEYYKTTLRFIDVKVDNNKAFRKKVTASPMPSPKYSKGDLAVLTNGVQGANDYKVHWLGWEARDFELTLDLESQMTVNSIQVSTLYDPKSWILHPKSVKCEVSTDGNTWKHIGTQIIDGDQETEVITRNYTYLNQSDALRFIRFSFTGTKHLPIWHRSAGGDSWVFVDEIVIE